jgi:hypothetical protein
VRAAVWSGEPPVEDEKDVLLTPEFGETEYPPAEVGEFEFWGWGVDLDLRHSVAYAAAESMYIKIARYHPNGTTQGISRICANAGHARSIHRFLT